MNSPSAEEPARTDLVGIAASRPSNDGSVESKPPRACCGDFVCPRSEISRVLSPNDPIEERVAAAAHGIAATCSGLNDEELQRCFSQFFEIGSECQLFDRFRAAYATGHSRGANA